QDVVEEEVICYSISSTEHREAVSEHFTQDAVAERGAVSQSGARRPVVFVALRGARHQRALNRWIGGAEESERRVGVFITHAEVDRQVARHLDIVLREIGLLYLASIEARGVQRDLQRGRLVIQEIGKVVERVRALGVKRREVKEALARDVDAELQ